MNDGDATRLAPAFGRAQAEERPGKSGHVRKAQLRFSLETARGRP